MRLDRPTGVAPRLTIFGAFGAIFALGVATISLPLAAAADSTPAANAPANDGDKPYVVQNGRVDHHVFNGYRRYGDNCLRCHGPDGAGSSYAPALVDSLKHMTKEQFENTVINGRQDVNTANQNVMPAFGLNPDVVENLDDIYGYLKARSDGVLGRGRPKKIGDDDDN
jgi:methanol metabolism-related c-type cytochrome